MIFGSFYKPVTSIIPNAFQGDILVLRTGDTVPADCRILESSDGFMVDNSAITGESEPIELDPTATHEKQLFSRNMAFFSATVVRGRAKAVVTRTVCTVWKIKNFSTTQILRENNLPKLISRKNLKSIFHKLCHFF